MSMFDYLDKYKRRMEANGSTQAKSYHNSTVHMINNSFTDSPTYKELDIGYDIASYETTGVRVLSETNSDERKLLFRPNVVKIKGEKVVFDGNDWMIIDFSHNDTTPKALIKRLDYSLKWKDEWGAIREEKCYLRSFTLETLKESEYFASNENNAKIMIQYNSRTKDIKINQRFVLGSNVYKVIGIDDFSNISNSKGFITMSLEMTEKSDKDNIANSVADNSHLVDMNDDTSGGGDWL